MNISNANYKKMLKISIFLHFFWFVTVIFGRGKADACSETERMPPAAERNIFALQTLQHFVLSNIHSNGNKKLCIYTKLLQNSENSQKNYLFLTTAVI